jgi:hypothetical protein
MEKIIYYRADRNLKRYIWISLVFLSQKKDRNPMNKRPFYAFMACRINRIDIYGKSHKRGDFISVYAHPER